ncbi:recombinase family protein [Candidatus Finniella inopinata]|uniref:Recombinase family protein n=1 Tax=Candidatus Finniella inopinata TaxID=1696036 RepID=A0A4Q7DFE2_9PROT|nr:recombinase family protein [Candidatus Finniella inopinata]RZI45491.1 recombinase family protein [Candidatus Finniella inopinata]
MAVIGYARVSSSGQKLDIQLGKLTSHGCDRIYQEKQSGLNSQRPQLMACLDYIREGDTLMVTKLDRLARSTLDLCTIAERLKTKKVIFKVLDQDIDTSGSSGRLLFHMLSAIAQFETEIRKERQTEGIKKAKEKGVLFGRLNLLTEKQAEELVQKRQEGVLIKDLMAEYKLTKKTIYNYLERSRQKDALDQSQSFLQEQA